MRKNYPLYDVESFDTVKEMLKKRAVTHKNHPAYKFEDGKEIREVTYGEVYETILSLGEALTEKGYQHKHIACIGHNSYLWICVYLTTLCSNNIFYVGFGQILVNRHKNII